MPELVADPEIAELTEEMRICFQLILAGRSKADIELQDKILDDILDEVGGWKVERFCEQDMAEFTNVYLQRLGHKHINFVWAGGYIGSWMQFGTPDWVKGYVPTAAAGLERDAAGGKLVQCGGDAMMGSGSGIPRRRRHGPRAVRLLRPRRPRVHRGRHQAHGGRRQGRRPPSATRPARSAMYLQMGWTDEQIWSTRSRTPSSRRSFHFQRKIKEAFDPNDVGDRMYPTLPEGYEPGS